MKPAKLPPEKIGYNAPSTEWGVIKSYLESNGFLIVESFAPRCPNCKDNPLMIFVSEREPYTGNHWQCPYCDSTVIETETNEMDRLKKENIEDKDTIEYLQNGMDGAVAEMRQCYDENAELKKQIELWKEYVKLLNDNSPVAVAYVHGWRCSDEAIKKGVEYRKKLGIEP